MPFPSKKIRSYFPLVSFFIQAFFPFPTHARIFAPVAVPASVIPISPSILFSDTSPTGAGAQFRDYAYDPIGNRTSVTEGASAGNYSANNLNQYDQVDLLFEDPAVIHKSFIFQQVSPLNAFHTFFTKRSFGFHATAL